MNKFPATKDPLVIRTDFRDQGAWEAIRNAIREPAGEFGFLAYVEFLDDPALDGLSIERLLELVPDKYYHGFFFVVDLTAIENPEHPILVVDASHPDEEAEADEGWETSWFGREFRAIPRSIQGIQNNLSVGNMGFEEFAGAVDPDGIYRRFR